MKPKKLNRFLHTLCCQSLSSLDQYTSRFFFFYSLNRILKKIVNFVIYKFHAAEFILSNASLTPVINHRHFCNIKAIKISVFKQIIIVVIIWLYLPFHFPKFSYWKEGKFVFIFFYITGTRLIHMENLWVSINKLFFPNIDYTIRNGHKLQL